MTDVIAIFIIGLLVTVVVVAVKDTGSEAQKVAEIRTEWVGKKVVWKGNKALVVNAISSTQVEIAIAGYATAAKVPLEEIQHLPEEAK